MKKFSNEEFIKKAREIHGDKYDYSKVNYIGAFNKVCIICPEHGEFWQLPIVHLKGCGCKKCSHTLGVDAFITKAKEIHGDKYDYSKVEYNGYNEKICIICPEHGEFWQTPHNHLSGSGCQKCSNIIKGKSFEKVDKVKLAEKNKDAFIKAAKKKFGNLFDYSDIKYIDNTTEITICSKKYGKISITPKDHLKLKYGHRLNSRKTRKFTKEKFVELSEQVHGKKYDYSKAEYKGMFEKICIICPEHGEFWQTPNAHIHLGQGCPICHESHLERDIKTFLDYKKVKYIQQCSNAHLGWLGLQRLDFYLPEYNIAIECQGEQHYSEKAFVPFKNGESLKKQINLDLLKLNKCNENGINLIYFVPNKKSILSCGINSIYTDENTFDKFDNIWELLES